MRQQNIRVERGNKGFGLSLIYKVMEDLSERGFVSQESDFDVL